MAKNNYLKGKESFVLITIGNYDQDAEHITTTWFSKKSKKQKTHPKTRMTHSKKCHNLYLFFDFGI